ncbi:uncharacterized protein LOC112553684 [Pomacea canaliculata]|uniref:uncharacterized protein LOC112553684 n=1 Tax=Pomacea canaliculata TaxID=400727 RepID=UPI000D72D07D|nr:uncharacterized protein LOC112553684 [Pomacea canaliculata]
MKACTVLFFLSTFWASAESAAVPPACNKSEQSYLFNSCLLPFGVAHLKFLPVMRASQTCLRQNIQCQAARQAVTCINNLEKTRLTNACWDGMRGTLDFLLDQHQFHCIYADLEATCYNIKETPITLISKSDKAMGHQDDQNTLSHKSLSSPVLSPYTLKTLLGRAPQKTGNLKKKYNGH